MALTVVKVGGSLFDLPDLRDRLRSFLATLSGHSLLVPGGGDFADAIRKLHRTHHFPEKVSHWLAIRTMTVNAYFLAELVPESVVVPHPNLCQHGIAVLDAFPFLQQDEGEVGCLEHSWRVTSDSIAARVAAVAGAESLVLCKSIDLPPSGHSEPIDWGKSARSGFVDYAFAETIASIPVRWVNLRGWQI